MRQHPLPSLPSRPPLLLLFFSSSHPLPILSPSSPFPPLFPFTCVTIIDTHDAPVEASRRNDSWPPFEAKVTLGQYLPFVNVIPLWGRMNSPSDVNTLDAFPSPTPFATPLPIALPASFTTPFSTTFKPSSATVLPFTSVPASRTPAFPSPTAPPVDPPTAPPTGQGHRALGPFPSAQNVGWRGLALTPRRSTSLRRCATRRGRASWGERGEGEGQGKREKGEK